MCQVNGIRIVRSGIRINDASLEAYGNEKRKIQT